MGRRKLFVDDVDEIKRLRQEGHTFAEIASRFRVTRERVRQLVPGRIKLSQSCLLRVRFSSDDERRLMSSLSVAERSEILLNAAKRKAKRARTRRKDAQTISGA